MTGTGIKPNYTLAIPLCYTAQISPTRTVFYRIKIYLLSESDRWCQAILFLDVKIELKPGTNKKNGYS